MKKLNFVLTGLSAVIIALTFTSCGEDTLVDGPEISFDQAGPIVTTGTTATITGSIVAEGELERVVLSKTVGESTSSLETITSFSTGTVTTTDDLNYDFTYTLSDVTENTTFKVRAEDKEGNFAEETIEIEAGAGLKDEVTNVKIYCTLGDGSGESTCASVDGSTYAPKNATAAEQGKVDFVYFYSANAGIFSPDDIPSVLDDAFTTWTVRNTTRMEIVDVEYDDVTLAEVVEATNGISDTSVEDLEVGDVVGFITDDDKVGVFEVQEIEPGYNGTDYIVINIKVQE